MVDALTFLSCCEARRILFPWSAMTGRSPLPATAILSCTREPVSDSY